MYNEETRDSRRFYAISFADDEPTIVGGSLIPKKSPTTLTPRTLLLPARPARLLLVSRTAVMIASLLLLVVAGWGGVRFWQVTGSTLVASTMGMVATTPVMITHPYTEKQTPLSYGIQVSFTEPNFFLTTRDAYIDAARTFIEADLAAMKLRYFEKGVLRKEYQIQSKGEPGTFFETPAGLYEIEFKKEYHQSVVNQLILPHSLAFQGNFFIHGTPRFETGEVASGTKGGIALLDTDAAELYDLVPVSTPVLVYERATQREDFVYEPKVPELKTPHYLIADIESNTVLAASDLDAAVPIASLTKLMTAVVAAEYINLDTRVAISQPSFVQSLIPRLGDRGSVSMYSLLELLLLESSNEAAEVIAGEVGRAQFVEHMNERAKTLGMTDTVFVDPSGLEAGNVSSVGDLLRLIQYIYEKRRFIVEISAGHKLPDLYVSREFDNLQNFNGVEGLDNFIGGKIGETSAAKQTSVTLHRLLVRGEERILAIIILGSESRTDDVTALMQYATDRFGDK